MRVSTTVPEFTRTTQVWMSCKTALQTAFYVNETKRSLEGRCSTPRTLQTGCRTLRAARGESLLRFHAHHMNTRTISRNRDLERVGRGLEARGRHALKRMQIHGDVAVSGELSITGTEMVRNALNFAGGFITSPDPNALQLCRPSRGGKAAEEL